MKPWSFAFALLLSGIDYVRPLSDTALVEASMSKTNEWSLLKLQIDALTHDDSVEAGSIEEIFDIEFRRRFTELITKTAQRNRTTHYNWPRR